MVRFRKSIIIFGCIILCAVGALVAFLALSASGMIVSDPIELTITVIDNEKEYDGTPLTAEDFELTGGELLKDHKIVVMFIGEQTEAGVGGSSLTAKILDDKERDVSDKYLIRVEEGELSVVKRFVSVTQNDVVREYTGEPVFGGDYTVVGGTSLCTGHRLERSSKEGMSADVGMRYDTGEPVILDALGNDVTENYDMEFTPGLITVEPRAVEVAPVGTSKVYDGKALYADYRITQGSLLTGHRLEVTFKQAGETDAFGQSFGITQAGSAEVEIDNMTVFDADGNDVTSNYNVTPSEASATLTVSKRDLHVEGIGKIFEYSGEAQGTFDSTEATFDGLCEKDKLAVKYIGTIKDVGTVENDFEVIVENGDGTNVTDSYRVVKTTKNLEVTPKTITVETDGEITKEFTGSVITLGNDDNKVIKVVSDPDAREYLKVKTSSVVLNAGKYEYTVVIDETKNYVIGNTPAGILTVTPKEIAVTVTSKTEEYTGEEIQANISELINEYKNLDNKDKLDLQIESHIVDAGTYPFTVVSNDSNYTVTGNTKGTVTVNPIVLTATDFAYSGSTKVYDGQPLEFDVSKLSVSVTGLSVQSANGEFFATKEEAAWEAGDNKNLSVTNIVLRQNGKDVTSNYVIENGVISFLGAGSITPRKCDIYVSMPRSVSISIQEIGQLQKNAELLEYCKGWMVVSCPTPIASGDSLNKIIDLNAEFKDMKITVSVKVNKEQANANYDYTINGAVDLEFTISVNMVE